MDVKGYGDLVQLEPNQKFTQAALDSLAQEFFPENPGKFIQENLELIGRCQGYANPLGAAQVFGRMALQL